MDSAPEEEFDRLTRLAAKLLNAPTVQISLVDDERQYFKSTVGTELRQTPLSHSFCQYVVADQAPLVVTDARQDERLRDNPAIEEHGAVAYCGVPLTDRHGHTLGSFCAIEKSPREWSDGEVDVLAELASSFVTQVELRTVNRTLAAREQETRAIIDSAHDAFVSTDGRGRIQAFNPSAERLFGYRADEVIGHRLSTTILAGHPAGDAALARLIGPRDAAAPAAPAELVATHRSGSELAVEVSVSRSDTPGGPRINALIRDVAARHAAEHQRKHLAQAVESTPDSVITVDRKGAITSYNAGAQALYGWTADEMLGRFPDDRLSTGAESIWAGDLLPRLLNGENVLERALQRRTKDGRVIYVDLSAAPLQDDAGRIIGATAIARDVTEQHRLEQELAQSEARYRQTIDEAPIGIALVGVNGRWLQVNRALCEIVGYSEPELLALSFQDITHPDDLDADLELLGQVLAGERRTYQMDKRYLHKRGHIVWIRLSVSLIRDPSGAPMHFVSQVEDITAARESQLARHEMESRQGVLLSSLPDTMISLYDEDLRCVLLQGSLLEQQGMDPAQFEGHLLWDFLTADGRERLEPLLVRALAGEPGSLEYTGIDGRIYAVDIAPYRSQAGTVDGAFTVWREITTTRQAEIALSQARRDIDRFFSLSLDIMAVASADGRFARVNPAVQRTLGFTPEQMIGERFADYIHPDDRERTAAAFARQREGEEVVALENRYRTRDGSYRWLRWSATAVEDGFVFATAHDVTDRKQMEDALRDSREKALEGSRQKSEFVANMSHEIRTPLNGVVSMTELLLDTDMNAEQAEYAQVALTSAEALMRVINDILDFSKIEAGKLEILHEDFSVRAALNDVCEIVGVKAAERGLQLHSTIDEDVAEVLRGDGSRVRQVLMNLVSNAVKFTSVGEVNVEVRLLTAPARVRFSVTDTGIGIARERLPSLFESFSQADATTTRRYGGTGLGLCISRQLVELMGGAIGADSEPGQGSHFWFELPYEPGTGFEADLLGTDLTGMRVLVVDDVAADRQLLESYLASWGISPHSAQEGAAALQLLRRAAETGRPYETALIHADLPGMAGLELARAIKSIPSLRPTRLILSSATPLDPETMAACGVEAHTPKPIRASRLYNQLMTTLRRYQAASPRLSVSATATSSADHGEQRPKVLVAEDNTINQFAAIRLLGTLGIDVDIAANGREAIVLSATNAYAAVFMDCQMPEVDGYTATKVIRARERQEGDQRVPIVALTAHALEGDKQKCLAAGMDEYLTKPLRIQTLQELVERVPGLGLRQSPTGPGDAAGGSIFDPAPLSEFGDPETEAALAAMFLDQAAERVDALSDAIRSADPDRLHSLAHGLKGSAATVGAARMSELSRELCELAKQGVTDGAAEVHDRLAQALDQTSTALNEYIAHAGE